MAHFAYTQATLQLGLGDLHLDTDDIRAILVRSSTTADTDEDATFIDQIGTLDEASEAPALTGYSRVALTTEAFAVDNANDRSEFTSDAIAFGALGNGQNATLTGMILYLHVNDDTDSIPLFYIDLKVLNGGSDVQTNGGTLTITPNAEGWAQITVS